MLGCENVRTKGLPHGYPISIGSIFELQASRLKTICMIRSVLLVFFMVIGSVSKGQETPIRTIVLINGKPFMADLTEKGDLIEIFQKVDNYFTTRESHNAMVTRLSKIATPQASQIVFFEKEEEPVLSFSAENTRPITYGNSQYIGFSPGRALLLKAAVDQIRRISDSYRKGEIQSISVTSFQNPSFRSRSLARNRAKAIRDLLGSFGVPNSVVQTQNIKVTPDAKVDFVQVKFGG